MISATFERKRIVITPDEAKQIIGTIKGWLLAIRDNENRKLTAMEKGTLLKRYSISDVEVDYSQDASYWYVQKLGGSILGVDINSNGVGVWKGIKVGAETESVGKKFGKTDEPQKESMGINGQDHDITFNLPGSAFKIGLKPAITALYSDSRKRYKTYLAGSGFHMGDVADGYFDIDVYTEPVDTAKVGDNENWVWDKNLWKWISAKGEKDYEMGQNHDFVFIVRGGAERTPWHAPDSTIVSYPSKPLGAQTLKIDNPKIYISQTTVNNLPKNERAVFSIRLTNETEYQGNVDKLKTTPFYLCQEHNSNQKGARLYVDGKALGDGIEIIMYPGQSIVKTLEVERGASAYDYEDIGITLAADKNYSLYDTKRISVHYLPESTPVRITAPADKWVMNTLSSKDESGKYYIPVKIDGFDVNCDNFDHIEFQYKKQTEGESAWTNLCSYYAKDDEYYQRATGTKRLLTSGSISNLRFYGEKDPMEMKYDLRAVSFCRLGSGYVTYASPVASGIKDTRTPDIFGNPEPSSGILGHGDILSLTFSEDIAYNYLDETANFQVTGYTNTSAVESKNYLILGNTIKATSLAESYVATHDFSVEMMATVEKPDDKSVLFKTVSEETPEANIIFCVNANRLELYRSNTLVAQSEVLPVDMKGGLTHVGFTYGYDDRVVRFFVGDNVIKSEVMAEPVLSLMGYVVLENTDSKVGINNLRTWYKELSSNEIANLTNAQLTGKEIDIIAYWPLVDGFGSIAKDYANGNNMVVTNPEWHTMDGKSLLVYQKPVVLQGQEAYKFSRQATEDYTLAFWFQNWWLDETKDNISLFHAGDPKIDKEDGRMNIFLKSENGKHYLKLECGGEVFDFGTSEFSTLQWHHIALSVNHSLNSVNMYLDGEMVGQIPGTKIGGISTSEIAFGDENTAGLYDEIEFWHLALPANYIKNNFCTQRNGDEMGLAVYLPFETMKRDGTIYNMQFSAQNHASYVEPGKSSVNINAREPLFDVAKLENTDDIKPEDQCWGVTDFEAPVNASDGIESLPFSWTGTNTKLQINIKKEDYDINGRYVNVTVRGVEDLAGNPMSNPVMWTVYVQRNALFFADKNIRTTTSYGEKKNVATTLKNESGRRLSFTIDPECTWLTPSLAYGQLEPLEEQDVEFEISDGLSPGAYSAKVMLQDENGLTTSLNVYVTVTIEEPSWTVTTDKTYNRTMNIMSTVYQQNNAGQWVIDADTKDIVGAFVDNVCVGKAHLTVDKVTGTSYLYMTIRGREQDQNKGVVFRLWDASTGNILYLDRGERVDGKWNTLATTFEHDAVIGADDPVEMRTALSRIQTIALNEGWNWISFNVSPPVGKNVFMDTDVFTPDDMFKCASGTSIYKGNGEWTSVDTFVPTKSNVYEIYVKNPGKLSVDGSVLSDEELEITLDFGNKSWAEMAYLLDVTLPTNVALADFPIGAKAPVGTMIKSYNEFAVARADGQWIGSLQFMRPGTGYYVNCNGDRTPKTVRYIRTTSATARNRNAAIAELENENENMLPVASTQSESMMPVIATFKDGDVCTGDILVAYSNGEVVGVAQPGAQANGADDSLYENMFFISVHAADGDKIDFVKYRDGEAVAATKKGLAFTATGIVGALDNPYLIDFSETSSDRIYDLSGRRHTSLPSYNGVYIIGNKKVLIKK